MLYSLSPVQLIGIISGIVVLVCIILSVIVISKHRSKKTQKTRRLVEMSPFPPQRKNRIATSPFIKNSPEDYYKFMDQNSSGTKKFETNSHELTKLLREINLKLDGIKSDTDLILEYTAQIETLFEQLDDIEGFLKQKLASDFELIKYAWDDYRQGTIGKREFIAESIKVLGKKFVKSLFSKISPL